MKTCIYCGREKPLDEFSDEHIWPEALGGDHLPSLWRTQDVCGNCNNMSGVFVDGSFIKSWMGSAERTSGAIEYLSPIRPGSGVLPLAYIGVIRDIPSPSGMTAEYWRGPCGASIIHIRPNDEEEHWKSYAGGDPRAKRSKAGRAYLVLTSKEPFWIAVTLRSFKAHFKKAERFIVNCELPPQWSSTFKNPDLNDPQQAADMEVVTKIMEAGRAGEAFAVRAVFRLDVGSRFLAKLALAVGWNVLGEPFLATDESKDLRRAFREPDFQKRKQIPTPGAGYLSNFNFDGAERILRWPGGWVLVIKVTEQSLGLTILTPLGKPMTIAICKEPTLIGRLDATFRDGLTWLTVPSLGEAVGPIPFTSFLAHQLHATEDPQLKSLAEKRMDSTSLPPCGGGISP